jgi:hypothetical protein
LRIGLREGSFIVIPSHLPDQKTGIRIGSGQAKVKAKIEGFSGGCGPGIGKKIEIVTAQCQFPGRHFRVITGMVFGQDPPVFPQNALYIPDEIMIFTVNAVMVCCTALVIAKFLV